jgi:ATP-dependent Clp protease ATP-binding subunit ClpC
MKHKFTLFVQKHHGGEHTVIVVEVPDIRAHHVVLDKCRDQVCRALAKRIRRIEPSALAAMKPCMDQEIKAVRVEMRPRGRKGMPRRNRIEIKFSLIISNYDEEHILVRVPKLLDPLSGSRLFAFLVRREEDLRSVAQQELQVYFQDYSLERLLEFGYAKSETIETVTVLAEPKRAMDREEEREEESYWGLESAGEKLTTKERAKANRAYEMDEFVEEILETLASKQRNSVLLVGPPQVGKSAVIDEVARRIVRKECDRALHRRDIWRISAQSIEAPKVWWEGVLKNIVEEAERKNIILCLENITDFLEGATSFTRGAEMARFLKPYIASGQIVFIAETTLERYGAHAGRSGGFLEQFKTIRLEEPPIPKVRRILNAVRTALEPRYSASVEPGCIDTVIELTRRFQPYSAFPGKGVILLEQAVLSVARGGKGREKRRISRKDVIRQFSLQSGMPEFILSDDRRLKMSDVRRFFSDRVMGQEEAVKAAANLISVVKAGINDPDKPLGTFIFIGPTGVGKTEMAKTIAEYLFGSAERLSRLDMSEYSSIEAVEKLVGLPGDPRGGNLTRKVIEQPFTVLLLDEIEKARPEVFDLLLQVLGEGRLTTSAGLTADFRNSIIIMTSNLGASHREMKSLGFRASDGQGGADHYLQKMEEFFRPEFINRIDRVVLFRPLSREAMRAIARKELESVVLREGLLRRDCLVEIDDGLVDLLVERGFSPSYGARPLKREIERLVTQRIADYLSSHPGERLPLLRVSREGDGARIEAVEMREVKETVTVQRSNSLAGGDVAKRKIGDRHPRDFPGLLRDPPPPEGAPRRGEGRGTAPPEDGRRQGDLRPELLEP